MKDTKLRNTASYLPALAAFGIYFLITTWQLTHSSLWLCIHDSEWWFRFAGVVFGFGGAVGMYRIILGRTGSAAWAAGAVIAYAFNVKLVYYYQECAEYSLMLGLLPWAVCFFLASLDEASPRNVGLFALFCVLAVYTQYGAAFPSAAFGVILAAKTLASRDNRKSPVGREARTLLVAGGAALVCAALLYCFFTREQIANQALYDATDGDEANWDAYRRAAEGWSWGVVAWDFLVKLRHVFTYEMFGETIAARYAAVRYAIMLLMAATGVGAVCLACSRRKDVAAYRWWLGACVLTWVPYYFAVKTGLYAHGIYGFRWDIFFIPMFFVSLVWTAWELIRPFGGTKRRVCTALIALIGVMYCTGGFTKIAGNWSKQDIRGAVAAWYATVGNTPTLVMNDAETGFEFYLKHDARYSPEMDRNVIFIGSVGRHATPDEYAARLRGLLTGDQAYMVSSHLDGLSTVSQAMESMGWTGETVFVNRSSALVRWRLARR
ncbi:MAG: hypothetical protein LBR38_09050 [Synergistaceae bacterium]|jgi:hypothetical protein|nr:hypothetical protein [Synergistaceae bacterium]